jgi:hypothetical protein
MLLLLDSFGGIWGILLLPDSFGGTWGILLLPDFFGGTWGILLHPVLLEALFERQFSWLKFTFFLSSLLIIWLIVGLNIAVLLHPVPRVVPLGFSLHPSFYTSILALPYESVGR